MRSAQLKTQILNDTYLLSNLNTTHYLVGSDICCDVMFIHLGNVAIIMVEYATTVNQNLEFHLEIVWRENHVVLWCYGVQRVLGLRRFWDLKKPPYVKFALVGL